jgi:hypothetical protein
MSATKKKSEPFSVCGVWFKNPTRCVEYTRAIVASYTDGAMMSAEHAAFIFDLIVRRHDEPDDKLVPGRIDEIVGIRVRHQSGCPQFGRSKTNVNHCMVVYSDGQEIDFSWKKCCEASFSAARDADHALRRAAEPHVREYKRRRFSAVGGMPACDATGVPLAFQSCQVDHYPLTWVAVRDRFLASNGITLESIETVQVVPDGGCVLKDDELLRRFQQHHEAVATLRLVHTTVNQRSWRDSGAIRK